MKYAVALLSIIIGGSFSLSGQELLKPMAFQTVAQPMADSEEMTLIDENFSKMSAGSEATPDTENIADKRTGAISADYTSLPDWSGAAIYQAGGSCAILKGKFSDGNGGYTEETGFIRTPQGAYAGNLKLTFRARLLDQGAATDKMDVALLNSKGRLESKFVNITGQWKIIHLISPRASFRAVLSKWPHSHRKFSLTI